MKTPVALLMFNRPDTTAQVLASIAKARPSKLFLIADGPRADRPDDVALCAATRAAVERIDWDCEVLRCYSDTNLGCAYRVSTGISWVFDHVEQAIILEDDCLPNPTFYRFCDELLTFYQDDERIMMISGNNFLLEQHSVPQSYYFHTYTGMWGWATWRRSWRHHDLAIKSWPALRDTDWLDDLLIDPRARSHWRQTFDQAYASGGAFHTWDAQWYYALWSQHGLAIAPKVNLVSNIGFRPDATHTKGHGRLGNLPAHALVWPLAHPPAVIRDRAADRLSAAHGIPLPPPEPIGVRRYMRRLAQLLPTPMRAQLLALRAKLMAR
jgi:hypothetical protein